MSNKGKRTDPADPEITNMKITIAKNEVKIDDMLDRLDQRHILKKNLDESFEKKKREWDSKHHMGMQKIRAIEKSIKELMKDNNKFDHDIRKLRVQKEELNEEYDLNLKKYLEESHRQEAIERKKHREAKEKAEIIENFIELKPKYREDIERLKHRSEELKNKKKQIEILKDNEKISATDKLKKHMLERIQVTKTNLFALRKEQLDSKTRLTVLQNYQLTTELEYQSKQTEKLFFKNQKLIQQVKSLKRDVEIHKQVEGELAKRSHFCQKLKSKLTKKIEDVKEEIEEFNAAIENNKKNVEAKHDENSMKKDRLDLMKSDIGVFEEKLAQAQNMSEIVKNSHENKKSNLAADIRRFKCLLRLFERFLELQSSSQFKNGHNSSNLTRNSISGSNRSSDGNYDQEWASLEPIKKDMVIRGLISMLSTQLENYGQFDVTA